MSIKMIRIDDRLIHGQIVTAWAKRLSISKIWIIDDGVASDSFIIGVMKMVAPADTELIISPVSDIPELLPKYDNSDENVLVLIKYPYVAKELFKCGVKVQGLNVGGMGASSERQKLYKNISASAEEKETLKEIQDMGVDVYFQVIPDDKKTSFEG